MTYQDEPFEDQQNGSMDDPAEFSTEDQAHDDIDLGAMKDAVQSEELTRLRAERDDLYQRLARATADFRNAQRRIEQDKQQAVQYANSELIKQLLPVIDNFERALSVDPSKSDAASILKGMQIIHDQWMDVLKRQDVEPIAPSAGEPFDPNHHEALMQQPSEKYDHPTVTQLLQKGYLHHGRALRPAGVAVSRKS